MALLNIPYVELVIDFINTPYQVNEMDGFARVTVGVVSSGELMRNSSILVELSFSDGAAMSKQACLV